MKPGDRNGDPYNYDPRNRFVFGAIMLELSNVHRKLNALQASIGDLQTSVNNIGPVGPVSPATVQELRDMSKAIQAEIAKVSAAVAANQPVTKRK